MSLGGRSNGRDDVVPDFVVLGHVTLDRVSGGHILGGTTAYAALTAQRLGYRAAIITTGAPAEAEVLRAEGIRIISAPSAPTIFENIYTNGRRQQYLRSVAAPVTLAGVPEVWRRAPVVHLGPLTQELDSAVALAFPRALIGATPQGWLRRWDADGRVSSCPWQNVEAALAHVDALVFSEQDVDDPALIPYYTRLVPVAVVTRGGDGCDVYRNGEPTRLPAYPTEEVEPTGAGDVFAAAFFLKLQEVRDPLVAGDWANCVASFAVEAPGIRGIPTLDRVLARQRAGVRA